MIITSCLISVNETKAKLHKVDDNEKHGYFGNKCHVCNFCAQILQSQRVIVKKDKDWKFDNGKLDGMPYTSTSIP